MSIKAKYMKLGQESFRSQKDLTLAMNAKAHSRNELFIGETPSEPQGEIIAYHIPKSDEEIALIKSSLRKNQLFHSYSEAQHDILCKVMQPRKIRAKEKLIEEGEYGYVFFVVYDGLFEISKFDPVNKNRKVIEQDQTKGAHFGELSLLFNAPRASTITAKTDGRVFQIKRDVFQAVLLRDHKDQESNAVQVLKTHSSLLQQQRVKESTIQKLVKYGHLQSFLQGGTIITKGEEADFFYFVIAGEVEVLNSGDAKDHLHTAVFKQGDHFGESALTIGGETSGKRTSRVINVALRAADVVAKTNCNLLVLDRVTMIELLGSTAFLRRLDEEFEDRILRSVPLLSLFSKEKFEKVKATLHPVVKRRSDKTPLFNQGDIGKFFYIIKTGTVRIERDADGMKKKWFLGRGEYFGHLSLLEDKGNTSAAAFVQSDKVELFQMKKDDFEEAFEEKNYMDYFHKAKSSTLNEKSKYYKKDKPDETKNSRTLRKTRIDFRNQEGLRPGRSSSLQNQVKFKDVKISKEIGKGGFGTVTLANHNNTQYALKIVPLAKIAQDKKYGEAMLSEKKMLLHCCHPLLLKLYATFKDRDNIYFLIELIKGADLFTYIYSHHKCLTCDDRTSSDFHQKRRSSFSCNHQKRLPECEAKFYVGSVVEVLGYLHDLNVAYRDLKLENIMIDNRGHVKLIDMGFAKEIEEGHKALEHCGTLDYLAPEIILGKPHDKTVDIWALGVLIFEIITGTPPFSVRGKDENRSEKDIIRNITKNKMQRTRYLSESASNLVKALLVTSPVKRLGVRSISLGAIKSHEWFEGVNFEDLREGKVPPPWVPEDDIVYDPEFSECDDYDEFKRDSVSTRSTVDVKKVLESDWYKEF